MQRYQQLYISDETGKLGIFGDQVNSNLITGIFHKESPSNIWTLQHNMNTDCIFLQIYNENLNEIELLNFVDLIKINDLNTVSIYFSEELSGYVQMIFFTPI